MSSEPVWEGIKVTETQTEASREIDSIFPDALRSRVLHFVQFLTTPRMDDLGKSRRVVMRLALTMMTVNQVFDVSFAVLYLPN